MDLSRRFRLFLIVLSVSCWHTSALAAAQHFPARGARVEFGINGHPLNAGSYYGLSAERQISLLVGLRLRTYRVNVNPLRADKFERLSRLVALADRAGIRILPVINLPAKQYSSGQSAYAAAKAAVYRLARRFDGRISVWELGNEYDLYCVKPGADGASADDYDARRFAVVEGLIRGMLAGLYAGSPSSRSIVQTSQHTGTSLDSGFLRKLLRDGVTFDIIGYHYYSRDGRIPQSKDGANSLKILHERFHKPIWITEFDRQSFGPDAGPNSHPAEQGAALEAGMTEISEDAAEFAVIGADIYELLDQPELLNEPAVKPNQAQFGILDSRGGATDASRAVAEFLRAY